MLNSLIVICVNDRHIFLLSLTVVYQYTLIAISLLQAQSMSCDSIDKAVNMTCRIKEGTFTFFFMRSLLIVQIPPQ